MIETEKIAIAIRNAHEEFAFRHTTFCKTLLRLSIQILFYCICIPLTNIVLLMTMLYKTFIEFKGCAKPKVPTLGLRYFPKEQLRESLPNAFRINIYHLLSCVITYAPRAHVQIFPMKYMNHFRYNVSLSKFLRIKTQNKYQFIFTKI